MYLVTENKTECCGCTACEQVCPKNCIKMVRDEEGFKYPLKDEISCISCGLCEKVCPISNKTSQQPEEPYCYYGWHKDEKIRASSTSGAAFVAILQVCKEMGIRYYSGAVYDENLHVHHICTDDSEDLIKMQTSKYVQSEIDGVFRDIKGIVSKDGKVLFSGTPCQVDALRLYLGPKLQDKVITVGLVCHGVASPMIFEKYINEIESAHKSKVQSIRFRDKRLLDGHLNHRFTTVKFENGLVDTSVENPYTIAFGLGYMHRPSCSECKYATPLRNFDLTIGDFWGIVDVKPELSSELSKGISLILAHTVRGKEIADCLSEYMNIEKLKDYHACINKQQQQLSRPYAANPKKALFISRSMKSDKGFTRETGRILFIRKCITYKRKLVHMITTRIRR